MAQRKTKAIVVASPKEQTPRAPGPALLPLPLQHKYHYFNTQNIHIDTFFETSDKGKFCEELKTSFHIAHMSSSTAISPIILTL